MEEGRKIEKAGERRRSNKGQVAVILILITAVALVFYAISLNFGRLSQTKTLVTIASDTGAAQLASGMAGYGQSLSKTQLGGQQTKCASTSLLVAIITLIIVIIIVVVTQQYYFLAYVAIFLAAAAVVMQAAIIQPGITNAWNRITQKTMSTRDQLIENAIQGGLQKVVTDQVTVPDVVDLDGDRAWEPMSTVNSNTSPADEISRFAVFYNERMKTISGASITEIQNFVNALEEFLHDGVDGWGIYDDSTFSCSSAECNPCCVPDAGTFYGTAFTGNRPTTCSDSTNDGYWQGVCVSPYSGYPWAYQKYPENPGNGFFSFREQIGRDDEHQLFEKNPLAPNGTQIPNALSGPPTPPINFLLQDTTEYYVNPPFNPSTDNRKGIFPFFYKAADWGVGLAQLDPGNYPAHCYWWSLNYGAPTCTTSSVLPPELSAQSLNLPNDPAGLIYNTTPCVDGFPTTNTQCPPPATVGAHPLAPDKITFPDDIVEDDKDALGNPDPKCAQQALDGTSGFWKRGMDRYCSDDPANEWPYFSQCVKHGVGCLSIDGTTYEDCLCAEMAAVDLQNAKNFPDDVLDDIIYGLPDFIDWAEGVLDQSVYDIKADFTNWYGNAAHWIEPGTGAAPWGSNAVSATSSCPACCSVCNAEDGGLITWLKEIQMMIDRLETWKDNTSYASSAGVCDEAWCVPGSTCPGGGSTTLLGSSGIVEAQTFNDPDGDGTNGDIDDIIVCLDWNVSDTVTTSDSLVTATGNAQKFQACYSACNDVLNNINLSVRGPHASQLCKALPRSLVPGFDGTFVDLNVANLSCGATCSSCIAACAGDAVCIAACSCGGCACSDAACLSGVVAAAKGSCADAAYMTDLQQSAKEAENQVAKFNQREVFLSNRVNEVNNILNNVLIPARDKFDAFLYGSEVQDLIQYRINYSSSANDEGLPYQAIYGWKDDPPTNNPTGPRKWHVVKMDARIPDKCDNLCGAGGASDPGWPRINTYTKNWGTKRCYELVNTSGMVKFRTTRFDEPTTTTSLFFPNGMPIWQFRRDHPQRIYDSSWLTNLESNCNTGGLDTLPDGTPTIIYEGAFMINKETTLNGGCWDQLHRLLSVGTSSEACAQYYWHSGTNQGMGFKFVDCSSF